MHEIVLYHAHSKHAAELAIAKEHISMRTLAVDPVSITKIQNQAVFDFPCSEQDMRAYFTHLNLVVFVECVMFGGVYICYIIYSCLFLLHTAWQWSDNSILKFVTLYRGNISRTRLQ